VYCGSLFTHIDDLAEAWFAELHRVLRPGGRLYFSINDQHAVRIFEGEGDPAAYATYYERGGGKATWDSFVAKLSRNPGYQRFRRGEAYMFTMGRSMEAHVMWNTEVLCQRLSWGYRQLSVNPHSYGHQSTVLLERILLLRSFLGINLTAWVAGSPDGYVEASSMPKFLRARPPLDDSEARKIRRLADGRHASADWSERARIVALSWDGLAESAIAVRVGCH
jgi:SAM-dependent methyltransferase